MGKGTITGGGTDGLYTVAFDYGSQRADQLIAAFEAALAEVTASIETAEQANADAILNLNTTLTTLNGAIIAYAAASGDDKKDKKKQVEAVTESAASAAVIRDKTAIKVSTLRYKKLSLESRLANLRTIDASETDQVWCADFTEDAEGQVAIIEINGEGPKKLIAPAGRPPGLSDGNMSARGLQSPEQIFLNAAILPGWQKFSPTYRLGTIRNIDYDNDKCSVNLDTARSSAQFLPINQDSLLTDVSVEYMGCNAGAFDEGDHVVVFFEGQSWDRPKVIGFASNPKPCGPAEIAFIVDFNGFTRNLIVPMTKRLGEPGEATYSSPSPGYEVFGYSATEEYPSATAFVDESELQYRRRIRFDMAFQRTKKSEPYFDSVRKSFDVVGEGLSYDLDCIAPASTIVDVESNVRVISATYTGPTTVTSEQGAELDVWTGSGTVEKYRFSSNPGTGLDYIDCIPDHATAFMKGLYSPLEEITVLIDGKQIPYTLKTFGPPPQMGEIKSYIYNTKPDGSGLEVSDEIWQFESVIYERRGG